MWNEPISRPLCLCFVSRLAEGERFALRKDVREQHVVLLAKLVERLVKADEIAGNETGPLVDELVERVLAVGPGLTPIYRAGVVGDMCSFQRDVLAVALHRQLLQVGREAL